MKMLIILSIILISHFISSISSIRVSNKLKTNNKNHSNYSNILKLIDSQVRTNSTFKNSAFNRLAYLVDTIGPRLWGSKGLDLAEKELLKEMKDEKFENPRLEVVPIPNTTHWVRGKESLTLFSPREVPWKLGMIGLGKSIGGNVTGEIIVVNSFDDLKKRNSEVSGKIVLFNQKWENYHKTVKYRLHGASKASKYGAIGCLVRSITPKSIYTPHTGLMVYNLKHPKIPAAAITLEDADMFQRMKDRGQKIVVNLYMEAKFLEKTISHNVIGEIIGYEKPNEIVLMGGHLDSWDTGSQTGANDDGGGLIVCFEALRVLTKLGLRPRRTIRFIAWAGEEMGDVKNGAETYVENAFQNRIENHILAFESDLGTTDIIGFGYTGNSKGLSIVNNIAKEYLNSLNASFIKNNDGISADTETLNGVYGVPVMRNLVKDTEDQEFYFTYHHTAADSMYMMSKEDLDRNVIVIASMMYIIADLENSVGRENFIVDLSKLGLRKKF